MNNAAYLLALDETSILHKVEDYSKYISQIKLSNEYINHLIITLYNKVKIKCILATFLFAPDPNVHQKQIFSHWREENSLQYYKK